MDSIFSYNKDDIQPSHMVKKIKNGEWMDIITGLCDIKEGLVVLDYHYFKYFASNETYSIIINHVTNQIDKVLMSNDLFTVHINMKNLTIAEVEKHKHFIRMISTCFKERYPNKLFKCFIHNAPFVFAQIFGMISFFIDKETQEKIELVPAKK